MHYSYVHKHVSMYSIYILYSIAGNKIVAAVVGGIIVTLLFLSICLFILCRIKCTGKSSNNKKLAAQNQNAVNLDITVNLDTNPSYQFVSNSNDDTGMSHQEYDVINDNCFVEENDLYEGTVEETTKRHCKNLAYVGSTK